MGRQLGMGPGGITFVDMWLFARTHGIENIPRFVRFIRAMDREFLSYAAERVKAQG